MRTYAFALVALLALGSCAPNAPIKWIDDEFKAIQKYCLPGEEGTSKTTPFNDYRIWRCTAPADFEFWEKQFLTAIEMRGWKKTVSPYDWAIFCNKKMAGVVLSYGVVPKTESKKWSFSISLRFPAAECGKSA